MKLSLLLAVLAGLLWWLAFGLLYGGGLSDPFIIGSAVAVGVIWMIRWHLDANRNAKPSTSSRA